MEGADVGVDDLYAARPLDVITEEHVVRDLALVLTKVPGPLEELLLLLDDRPRRWTRWGRLPAGADRRIRLGRRVPAGARTALAPSARRLEVQGVVDVGPAVLFQRVHLHPRPALLAIGELHVAKRLVDAIQLVFHTLAQLERALQKLRLLLLGGLPRRVDDLHKA